MSLKINFKYFAVQKDNEESDKVIEELEKIDDDCDKHGIQFVKTDDKQAAKEHGVKEVSRARVGLIK